MADTVCGGRARWAGGGACAGAAGNAASAGGPCSGAGRARRARRTPAEPTPASRRIRLAAQRRTQPPPPRRRLAAQTWLQCAAGCDIERGASVPAYTHPWRPAVTRKMYQSSAILLLTIGCAAAFAPAAFAPGNKVSPAAPLQLFSRRLQSPLLARAAFIYTDSLPAASLTPTPPAAGRTGHPPLLERRYQPQHGRQVGLILLFRACAYA